jgi:hypothetical protein
MLSDAIDEIHREFQAAEDRREEELRRRADVRRVDAFLLQVENLIEHQRQEVPPALMEEITRFVRPLSRKLLRALNRNVVRDPVRVLDVLFDAQQLILPKLTVSQVA